MGGGSYQYAYSKVDEFADEVERRIGRATTADEWGAVHPEWDTPERRALVIHLRLVSTAMRAVEWTDSGDGSNEGAAIRALDSEAAGFRSGVEAVVQHLKTAMKAWPHDTRFARAIPDEIEEICKLAPKVRESK